MDVLKEKVIQYIQMATNKAEASKTEVFMDKAVTSMLTWISNQEGSRTEKSGEEVKVYEPLPMEIESVESC